MDHLFNSIKLQFEAKANAVRAGQMKAYMKDRFEYYGVMAPERKEIVKQVFDQWAWQGDQAFKIFFEQCWSSDFREFNYVALDVALKYLKHMNSSWVSFYEPYIARDSWWDTVDFLSPSIIGLLVIKEPDTQIQLMKKWIASDNMWNRRSALIMQLKYAKSTNFDILKSMISDQSTSKEFFIQKAAGWALRQYSRVDPIGVSSFISKYQLPPLTKREGMRLILKEEGKW